MAHVALFLTVSECAGSAAVRLSPCRVNQAHRLTVRDGQAYNRARMAKTLALACAFEATFNEQTVPEEAC